MKDLKPIIAKNICSLRQSVGMTQLELSEKLNYSDKAVSKWERGESIPDVTVLKEIADIFNVSLDYLVQSEHKPDAVNAKAEEKLTNPQRLKNHGFITGMSIMLVWLIAALIYFILDTLNGTAFSEKPVWLCFIWAVPVSSIVWLVFNTAWFNKRRNFLIISILVWTSLASVYLSILTIQGTNIWKLFICGVIGQIIIILWSRLSYKSSPAKPGGPESDESGTAKTE